MEKTLVYGKGYMGKLGNRVWVAQITGTHPKFKLEREFLEATSVKRHHFNRPRTLVDITYDLSDGLYEMSESGERSFVLVLNDEEHKISPDDAVAIAQQLDEGVPLEQAAKGLVEATQAA
jgi:hypothetical protein